MEIERCFDVPATAWDRAPGGIVSHDAGLPGPVPRNARTIDDVDEQLARLKPKVLASGDLPPHDRHQLEVRFVQLLRLRFRIEQGEALLDGRTLLAHPSWLRVRAAILRTLETHPVARRDVERALADIDA